MGSTCIFNFVFCMFSSGERKYNGFFFFFGPVASSFVMMTGFLRVGSDDLAGFGSSLFLSPMEVVDCKDWIF